MRRVRHSKPPNWKRDERGAYLCAWCGKALGKKGKYCSTKCQFEVYARCYPNIMRTYVERRDGGICALCQCDTEKIKRILRHAFPGHDRWRSGKIIDVVMEIMGFDSIDGHFWEADHIIPFAEGGPNEPENMRTLCLPCHKAVTKEFAARRAAQNREARKRKAKLPLFQDALK